MFFFFTILALTKVVRSGEFSVFTSVFSSYNADIKPGGPNTTITVTVHIGNFKLLDVNQLEQSIRFFVDLRLIWKDPSISWIPSQDSQNTSYVKIPESTVWQSDVSVFSALQKEPVITASKRAIKVNYDGTIEKTFPQIIVIPCLLTVRKFPFDQQDCLMKVGPWAYTSNEVALNVLDDSYEIDDEVFRGNSEWKLVSINAIVWKDAAYGDDSVFDEAHYTIRLRRRWKNYLWILIIPTFICATLCIFGLFMPSDSTGYRYEKVSLGVTTLLSMSMVLETFSATMPKSNRLPLLGVYVLAEEILCAVATFITCIMSLLHERATTRQWKPNKIISQFLLCKSYDREVRSRAMSQQTEKHSETSISQQLRHLLSFLRDKTSTQSLEAQWMRIFDRLDIIAMVIFQVINILITIIVIVGKAA